MEDFRKEIVRALPEIGDEVKPSEQIGKAIEAFRQRQRNPEKMSESEDEIYRSLNSSKKKFPALLLGAVLEEESHRKNFEFTKISCPIPFQENNTTFILLSYLWKKAVDKSDFTTYFDEIKRGLGSSRRLSFVDVLDSEEFSKSDYENFETSKEDLLGYDIEKLAFFYFGYRLYKKVLPDLVPMESCVEFNGTDRKVYNFPDCGETSLRNFFNALLFNPETREFNVKRLKELTENKDLINYYEEKYKTTKNAATMRAHHDWAQVVSNLPGGIYVNKSEGGNYEITGCAPGMLSILQAFLTRFKFNDFNEFFKILDEELEIDIFIDEILNIKNGNSKEIRFSVNDNVITWGFYKGHFSMKYPEKNEGAFFAQYAKRLQEKIGEHEELVPFFVIYSENLNDIFKQSLLKNITSVVKSAILYSSPERWSGLFPIATIPESKTTSILHDNLMDIFVSLATQYMLSGNHDLMLEGGKLFGFTIERDRGIVKTKKVVEEIIHNKAFVREEIVIDILVRLLIKLVRKGEAIQMATEFAQKLRHADDNMKKNKASSIFSTLAKESKEVKSVVEYAKDLLSNKADWSKVRGLGLFLSLIQGDKDIGNEVIEEASTASKEYIDHGHMSSQGIWIILALFTSLVSKGKGVKEAKEVVEKFGSPKDMSMSFSEQLRMLKEKLRSHPR